MFLEIPQLFNLGSLWMIFFSDLRVQIFITHIATQIFTTTAKLINAFFTSTLMKITLLVT